MNARTLVLPAAVLVVLLASLALLLGTGEAPQQASAGSAPGADPTAPAVPTEETTSPEPAAGRDAEPVTAETGAPARTGQPAPEGLAEAGGARTVRITVFDQEGRPLPEAVVDLESLGRRAGTPDDSWRLRDWEPVDGVALRGVPVDLEGRLELLVEIRAVEGLWVRARAEGYGSRSALVVLDEELAERTLRLRPAACVAVGRLLDADEEPVPAAELRFDEHPAAEERDGRLTYEFQTDREGRFEVALEVSGSMSIAAQSRFHGRSAPRFVDVPERGRIDLGDLVLVGNGRIAGRVLLPDGTPVPGVEVGARIVGEPARLGSERGSARTDEAGHFAFEHLASGRFELTPFSEMPLPSRLSAPVLTGTDGLELVVDALLATAVAVDESGATVPLEWIELSHQEPDEDGEDLGSSASRRAFAEPAASYTYVLAADRPYRLQAAGGDGRSYFGGIADGTEPAVLRVELVRNPPDRARLVLSTRGVEPPEDARLRLWGLTFDGRPLAVIHGAQEQRRTAGGGLELELGGLEPGSYRGELNLSDAGEVGFADNTFEVELAAGETVEVAVELVLGGRIELVARTEDGGPATAAVGGRAQVELLPPGAGEWEDAVLQTLEVDATGEVFGSRRGQSVDTDGTPATSEPLRPGVWGLRATLEGHLPVETSVDVRAGETRTLEVLLIPEDE